MYSTTGTCSDCEITRSHVPRPASSSTLSSTSSLSSLLSSLDTYPSDVFSLAKPKRGGEKSLFYDTSVKISACPLSLSEDGPIDGGRPPPSNITDP